MTRDEHADLLADIAAQLAARVRDDCPRANARWLLAQLPDEADRFALLFVLAAAVPADVPWLDLTEWAHGLRTEDPLPDPPVPFPADELRTRRGRRSAPRGSPVAA